MKQVQISEELFVELVKYHVLDMDELQPKIKKELMDKMDRMQMRELYCKYKTTPTDEEKEKARQEYLNKRGIKESFRW